MKRNRNTRSLAQVLGEIKSDRGWGNKFASYRIFDIWEDVVGADLAEVTRPTGVSGKALVVAVVDQVWLNQLSFMKGKLLSRINAVPGGGTFSELRFQVNTDPLLFTEKRMERPGEAGSSSPDRKNLKKLDNLISSIDDERVREVIRKVWLRINR